MKPTFTVGKRKNSNYKLNNIKLHCEPSELILISSLSDLKREENLEKFNHLSSHDFTNQVGEYGDCHLFNTLKLDKNKFSRDEKILGLKDYIYLFDYDQDGNMPNIHKVLKKSNKQEIGFFVNPSGISTSDFIDEAIVFKTSKSKFINIKDNDLVFCCIPENENVTKKFSSNIELFIKDRIKKKKLIKFKVPNGIYDICETVNIPGLFKNISEFSESGQLLGHCIIKKDFNIKKRKRKK